MVDGQRVTPLRVFRKTVPLAMQRVNPARSAASLRHTVTLDLPAAVPDGADVSVRVPGGQRVEVRRRPDTVSEAVHVCHAGYPLRGPKKAYVGLWLGQDRTGAMGATDIDLSPQTAWVLRHAADGKPAAEGLLTIVKPGDEPHFDDLNFNGCDIYTADFSAVRAPGRYRLEVEGFGASPPFVVSPQPYAGVLRDAGRWYYHQRSGIEIAEPFGEGRTRPRNGHPADGLAVAQTTVRLGRTSEGFRRAPYSPAHLAAQPPAEVQNPDAWGGWHDAGDWDRRIQHMDVIVDIAALIEHFPSTRSLNLNIPETGQPFATSAARRGPEDSGDGATVLPDLVHEALWGLSLWRRTQRADGAIIGGVEYSLDGIEGSVSWDPVQNAYAYDAEEWAAYQFAAAAAKLGVVIAQVCSDRVLGAALIAEAEAAWDWAEAVLRATPAEALPPDDRLAIDRARVPAAAALYRATGREDTCNVFEAANPYRPIDPALAEGLRPADMALEAHDYVLAAAEHVTDPDLSNAILRWMAGQTRGNWIGHDYGLHNTPAYRWDVSWFRFGPGSNWRARRAAMAVMSGRRSLDQIADTVIEGMWFGLGCNPSNTSFIQGLGYRDFADPLVKDLEGFPRVPGTISFGVAGGLFRPFESRSLAGTIHPPDQLSWPRYAQIFECNAAILCAEHGIKSNTKEWLFACAVANEVLSRDAAEQGQASQE